MAWTYTASPFTLGQNATQQGQRDTVRFLIGDTDPSDQQLQDSEVDGVLSGTSASGAPANSLDPFGAAIAACLALSAKYTRKANKTSGDLSIQSGSIAKAYQALIPQIRAQSMRYAPPTPYSGGQSKADMETDREDDDLVQHAFRVGQDDNPDTAPDINGGGGFTQLVPS